MTGFTALLRPLESLAVGTFRGTRTFLHSVGRYTWFFIDCVRSSFTHGVRWSRVMDEAYKTGIKAFPVLATMAIFVGSILAIQGHASFETLGAQNLVGMFVALAGVREVCPLLAATMVAAWIKALTGVGPSIASGSKFQSFGKGSVRPKLDSGPEPDHVGIFHWTFTFL